MRFAVLIALLVALGVRAEDRTLELSNGQKIAYRLVEPSENSARPVAEQILRHLVAGRIEEAALLSNAPKRRFEVLQDYMASVGKDEFKRVYAQYFFPENRVVAEVAVGPRRLVVWDLGEAGHRFAGQFYVAVDGKFLMDDMPSQERSELQLILAAYRTGKIKVAPDPLQPPK